MGKDMVECIRSRQGKVGYKMKRYPLPTSVVNELQAHVYVQKATPWSVTFTEEFKQLAYDEYMRGKSIREIFSHAGLDVQKLGAKRLENFRTHLISKANDAGGLENDFLKKIQELEKAYDGKAGKRK